MTKDLKEKLKSIISDFETVRCVYIKKNDAFFLFRKIPKHDGIEIKEIDNIYEFWSQHSKV